MGGLFVVQDTVRVWCVASGYEGEERDGRCRVGYDEGRKEGLYFVGGCLFM
jgi:hypothetical protein